MEAFLAAQPALRTPTAAPLAPPAQVAPLSAAAKAEGASAFTSLSSGIAIGLLGASVAGTKKRSHGARKVTAFAVNEAQNVKVGDSIPAVSLDKGFPPEAFPLQEFCKGKKVVLVGLPGAFTPT
eukprot:CAMPEP_0178400290 /NCGR_PEP_ID=MMETSP0689_2-20121128/15714_1 /TAXON_ID=160604 /ORGANISM="Amphidinium massartii, Strain CS-259" /LENGTH=123 /DNA_ID=CAMNT_0020021083 /DNA_START=69 /DNA_END=440 /DNA_ORIENTATION=-